MYYMPNVAVKPFFLRLDCQNIMSLMYKMVYLFSEAPVYNEGWCCIRHVRLTLYI